MNLQYSPNQNRRKIIWNYQIKIMHSSRSKYQLPKLTQRSYSKNKYIKSSLLSQIGADKSKRSNLNHDQSISKILKTVRNQYQNQQGQIDFKFDLKLTDTLKISKNLVKTKRKQKKIINTFSINSFRLQNKQNQDKQSIYANFNQSLERKLGIQEIQLFKKPPHRYKTKMVTYQNSLVLFGGIGCEKNLTWAKITVNVKNQIDIQLPDPFKKLQLTQASTSYYGHSMKAYKGYAFIYGGVNGDIMNDLLVMNLKTMKFKFGLSAPLRRKQHAATMLGRFMVVHGGIEGSQTRNNLFYYDTELGKWHVLPSASLPNLSHHGMITIPVKSKRKVTHISDNNDWIYMFGGKNQKGQPSNKLFRLKIVNQFEIFSQQIKNLGQLSDPVPKPRHSFCFQYIQNGNILLYGGKQDEESYQQNLRNGTFNDTYLYNIYRKTWKKQQTNLDHRQGMAASSANGKVYIYGGFGDMIYADGNVTCMKISQNGHLNSSRLIEQIKTNKTLTSRKVIEYC